MWRVFLERVVCGDGTVLNEGWYGGKVTTINQAIYMRTTDKEQAVVFHDKGDVVRTVLDWRSRGYPCRAEPPIKLEV